MLEISRRSGLHVHGGGRSHLCGHRDLSNIIEIEELEYRVPKFLTFCENSALDISGGCAILVFL